MTSIISISCNFPNELEAKRVSAMLVEARLVACANMVNGQSMYWWDGKVQDEGESYVTYKTTVGKYAAVEALIKEHHSYDVPCIIAHEITHGSSDFLDWIRNETSK